MTRRWAQYTASFSALASQARQQWRESTARRWLHLWLDELAGLLPAPITARLGKREEAQLLGWPLPETVDCERPAILVLRTEQVLAQRIRLPSVAARNLHKVLRYELDKYTPYPAEQVHFVARVVGKHEGQADIELVAIAWTHLDAILTACRERGLPLATLDVQSTTGERRRLNLLPASAQKGVARAGVVNRWLWACALAVCVAIPSLYIHQRQQQLDAMGEVVAHQRQQVRHLQQVRQQLDETVGASRYLANLKARRPTVSRLLAELATCLGEQSWISELEVQDGMNVTFSGQSPRASALIAHVQTCPSLEQVQFQGVIRPDDTTGQERFSISARLQEDSDAPAD
ncbi:PilN domain-containing protein [Vreelandella sp. GE22]